MGQPEPELDPDAAEAIRADNLSASATMDADLAAKDAFLSPSLGAAVTGPGQAETVRDGPAGRSAVRGRHNWVPVGPRNVGGRVRAIAVEPGNSPVMYAAPASGGVFKSVDGGDSWFPLWHDEPSLSMAALAICAGRPAVVWAGTGETKGGDSIAPAGVWRSANAGGTWSRADPGQTILNARIHALAAHPTNPSVCWAAAGTRAAPAGTAGLYRTTDDGKTWTQFAPGRGFSDVRFATIGGTLRLFAVPQGTVTTAVPAPTAAGPFVVRLDAPDADDTTITPLLASAGPAAGIAVNGSRTPAPAAGPAAPDLGKLAIFAGGGAVAPVLFLALTRDAPGTSEGSYVAIFRSNDVHTAAVTAMKFVELPPAPTFGGEGQGGYNIAVAVSPDDPDRLAFGMVELYLHRNANGGSGPPAAEDWLRAQQSDLFMLDRGHHADHHDLLFAPAPNRPFDNGVPGNVLVLWDANDGGLSWSSDWATANGYEMGGPQLTRATFPPHADPSSREPEQPPMTWRKRSHGISASQMYDLTGHPRLPSVMGCGFQDNGVYLGLAGPTWQHVLAADGGFVAFDPDDPYRIYVSHQETVAEVRFPGRNRDANLLPGDLVQRVLSPRDLKDGFHDGDAAPFVAQTAFHPTQPGRVFTARTNRLYGTRPTTGDRWVPAPLGLGFEILHRPAGRPQTSVIDVLDTPGGRAIGLVPQRAVTTRGGKDNQVESRVRSVRPGPYAIGAGQAISLQISVDGGAPVPVAIPLTIGADLPASPTAVQVARYLAGRLSATRPGLTALPLVMSMPREIVIASTGAGAAQQVVLSGTALPRLSVVARAYHGADAGAAPNQSAPALPAIAPIPVFVGNNGMNLAGTALQVTREGGASQVDITFDDELESPRDPRHVSIGDLVEVLRRRLEAVGAYEVWTDAAFRGLRLTSTVPAPTPALVLGGTLTTVQDRQAGTELAPTPAAGTSIRLIAKDAPGRWRDTIDLTPIPPAPAPPPPPGPAPRTLQLADDAVPPGNTTAVQNLDAPFLGVTDVTRVTMVELCDAVRRLLATVSAVRMRCDLELVASRDHPDQFVAIGLITEVAFGPPGTRLVFAGDQAGRIYRSVDDGETWEHRPSPTDERFACEAIAVKPDEPDVVLVGLYTSGGLHAGAVTLFRSTDRGLTFTPARRQIDNDRSGADRRVLGVRALVFDPGDPDHVYAATDAGVFHSDDAGGSWEAFNDGLPNVLAVDLALAGQTRVLRVGGWGRGVWERRLGDEDVRDVALHIRTTILDDGTSQPTPGPDLLAPRPAVLRLDASPDVKVLRHDPRIGVLLDGVEYDEDVRNEDVAAGPAFVAVQVHNRGAFPTTGVRVTTFWAPAGSGPPPVPSALWPALADPVPPETAFGPWQAIGDVTLTGPPGIAGTGHEVVAPGYPRVAVIGTLPAFSWPADVEQHARIGVLAIVRSADDPLPESPEAPVEVLDLVRSQAKVGYRECTVIPAAEDDKVQLRVLNGRPITVVAVAGADNAANGAAPFGLAAVAAPGITEVRFGTPGPYALAGPARFQIQVDTTVTVTFAADDPELPTFAASRGEDVATVLNRELVAAGVPVRALGYAVPGGERLRLTARSTAVFTVAGAAAATCGVVTAVPGRQADTQAASVGPFDLSIGAPQTMTITATTTVEVRLALGAGGLPAAGPVPAAVIRTALNRQLALGGLRQVVAEPVRRRLSVRGSATEAAGARNVLGAAVLADLIAAPGAVAPADQASLFDVLTTHGPDTVVAAANHFYLRSANVGNVAEAAVRHRLFLVDDAAATPVTLTVLGAPTDQALPVGGSVITEFAGVPVPGVAAGDHRYVLAIADVDAAGLRVDPATADLGSLDALLTFCARRTGAAVREFVAR